jgi:hypothetical protein
MSSVRRRVGAQLIQQGMPEDEVRAVLSTPDPQIVRRHLELHRERLMERAVEERNSVDRVEDVLVSRLPWS